MEKLREAMHTALRDDSAATVGLRALLAHAATPFGVYYHMLPDNPDFTSQHYLTWYFLPGSPPFDSFGLAARGRSRGLAITAWSANPDQVDKILRRVRNRLDDMRKVTIPTSEVALHQIKFEDEGVDLFDDEYKAYYRTEAYRIFYREDITE